MRLSVPLAAVRRHGGVDRLRLGSGRRGVSQTHRLAFRHGFVNLQNVERLFFGDEIVYPDDNLSFLSTAIW